MRILRPFATLLALVLLGACGTKTSLTLPPKPAPAAGAAQAAPAQPADDSKAGGATAR